MKKRFKYYVLFADMRTGSNLFERTIENYKDFSCHGELFNNHFVGYPKKESLLSMNLEERENDPLSLISEMINLDTNILPGFRLFSDHDPRIIDHCLKDKDCAKIILIRNPLDSYVSFKIAQETDQWFLGDMNRRVMAKIVFNFDEFQEFLQDRKEYQRLISLALQTTGQTGFYLNFDDIIDPDVFNGIAKFLGSDETLLDFEKLGVRQNPEPLSDKVINYDEMYQQIRTLDIFEREIEPYVQSKNWYGFRKVVASDRANVIYFPIDNQPQDNVSAWLSSLNDDVVELHQGAEINAWLRERSNKLVITALQHPVERAYFAFCDLLLFKGAREINWLRNLLIKRYDMNLPNNRLSKESSQAEILASGYTVNDHRDNVKKFLSFLNGNLQGQTRSKVREEWDLQSNLIDNYKDWGQPQIIISPHLRAETFEFIEKQLGISRKISAENTKQDKPINLSQVYDAEIERLTRIAYELDYRKFSFNPWDDNA